MRVDLRLLTKQVYSAVITVDVQLDPRALRGKGIAVQQLLTHAEGKAVTHERIVVIVRHQAPRLALRAVIEPQHIALFVKLESEGLLFGHSRGVAAHANIGGYVGKLHGFGTIFQGNRAGFVVILTGHVVSVSRINAQNRKRPRLLCGGRLCALLCTLFGILLGRLLGIGRGLRGSRCVRFILGLGIRFGLCRRIGSRFPARTGIGSFLHRRLFGCILLTAVTGARVKRGQQHGENQAQTQE